jgi:pyridoxal phosphate enzyme (YggS family)
MSGLTENLARVRERMEAAVQRSGRTTGVVTLVAVTKGCGADTIRDLVTSGVRDLGENRVQEALSKMALAPPDVRWHLIGHLQENKITKILPRVFLVQSIDSMRLARAVHDRALRLGHRVPVLLEVKTAPEVTKHGVPLEAAADAFAALSDFDALEPQGLMTIGPLAATEGAVRNAFRSLRLVFDRLQTGSHPPHILSMGMSGDFEIAIEEGATMVRVGHALVHGS